MNFSYISNKRRKENNSLSWWPAGARDFLIFLIFFIGIEHSEIKY